MGTSPAPSEAERNPRRASSPVHLAGLGAACLLVHALLYGLVYKELGLTLTVLGALPALPLLFPIRARSTPELAGNWVHGVMFCTFTALVVQTGGLDSHATIYLAMVPFIAVPYGGMRCGLSWAALLVVVLVGVAVAESQGLIPSGVPERYEGLHKVALVALIVAGLLQAGMAESIRIGEVGLARASQAEAETREAAHVRSRSSLGHELRTPLNGVVGVTALLRDTRLDASQREFVEHIRSASEEMLALVDGVLDFPSVKQGEIELERVAFDVGVVTREAMETATRQSPPRNVVLRLKLDEELPSLVEGDPGRLGQVLVKLVVNALELTEQGIITVRVHASDGRLQIEVADTGVGMDSGTAASLFDSGGLAIAERLVQLMGGALSVRSQLGEGAVFSFDVIAPERVDPDADAIAGRRVALVSPLPHGAVERSLFALGADVKRVHAHPEERLELPAGELDLVVVDFDHASADAVDKARSEAAHQGRALVVASSWHLRDAALRSAGPATQIIPLRPSGLLRVIEERERCRALERAASEEAPSPALRVLVAEDDRTNQFLIRAMLKKLGYECHVVDNGRRAVDALADEAFSMIIMDLQMPELDGISATREIREGGAKLPIVALTANALEGDRQRCLAAGMDDYLTKPVRMDELGDTIGLWTSKPSPSPSPPRKIHGT